MDNPTADKLSRNYNILKPDNHLGLSSMIREIVFGVEDGMVSTLGAVTGIAVGSGDRYTILLAGLVIITVESISMGIGSFVSNSSSLEVDQRIIRDEKIKQQEFPEKERQELFLMFLRDGWSGRLASKMAKTASLNRNLMLKEHEYRELGIFPYQKTRPLKNALFMLVSYIIGGIFPLISYFLLPVMEAVVMSVILTLAGLFLLGFITAFYTNVKPVKAGLRLAIMGSVAFLVGLLVGEATSLLQTRY